MRLQWKAGGRKEASDRAKDWMISANRFPTLAVLVLAGHGAARKRRLYQRSAPAPAPALATGEASSRDRAEQLAAVLIN